MAAEGVIRMEYPAARLKAPSLYPRAGEAAIPMGVRVARLPDRPQIIAERKKAGGFPSFLAFGYTPAVSCGGGT